MQTPISEPSGIVGSVGASRSRSKLSKTILNRRSRSEPSGVVRESRPSGGSKSRVPIPGTHH